MTEASKEAFLNLLTLPCEEFRRLCDTLPSSKCSPASTLDPLMPVGGDQA